MLKNVEMTVRIPKFIEKDFRVFTVLHGGEIVESCGSNKCLVLISKNEEGKVDFDNIISTVCGSYDEACKYVLGVINPMLDTSFESTDELSSYLIELEEMQGYAPLFKIEQK